MAETRFYPLTCQSAFCGQTSCPADCPNLPALIEFKEWRDQVKAVRLDPIWSPTCYAATITT